MKQGIGIQVTFILEIKLQKYIFFSKYVYFFLTMRHFETLLGWHSASVYHNLSTKKKGFTLKSDNLEGTIDIQVAFSVEIKLEKYIF